MSLESPSSSGRVVTVVQARMSSKRLRGKVLLSLGSSTVVDTVIARAGRARSCDALVVAIPDSPNDDELASHLATVGVKVFRGPENDLITRIFQAAALEEATQVVRVTADCPFVDPAIIDEVVRLHKASSAQITTNYVPPTFPDGLDIACLDMDFLAELMSRNLSAHDREHVTTIAERNPEEFRLTNLSAEKNESGRRWTLDNPEDLTFLRQVVNTLGPTFNEVSWLEIMRHTDSAGIEDPGARYLRNYGHLK